MFRTLGMVVAVGLLAGQVGAQETYTIKIKKGAQGESALVKKEQKSTQQVKITDNNQQVLKEQDEKKSGVLIYRETIVERKPGQRPTRLKRQYEKATLTKDGETTTLPYQGKTVLIEQKDGKYTFRIEGGVELTGADAKELNDEFNKKKGLDEAVLEKILLPGKAVKVGESWKVDPNVIAKGMEAEGNLELIPEKTTVTGTLKKAYKKDGRQYGVIVFKLDLAPKAFAGEGQKITVQPGAKMLMEIIMDTCIDGTCSDGSGTMLVEVSARALLPDADNPMFTLTLNVTGQEDYQNKEVK
jgi:hypothetical protein